ncbi:DUF1636 domain-containing protein [Nostoc sp. NZL]|uniref:DUF1636 domain-containing protein n=1 Tax=Nostoc sp. NZL TaxID=2650612 RepID=UPI0018C806B4|nr:DUF1636 family protein [Nostoc sp. NZL]MBG1243508.1 DUF1636 domain-containing protein [Nostoc sp. NZL]
MPKHTLFVCKSCHMSDEEPLDNQHKDGIRLLAQLNTLSREKCPSSQLDIKPVGCMWACDHGCVAAISSPKKPTYLIVDLRPDESAPALLELMELYISNSKGGIPYEKIRELLQPDTFVQIPPILIDENAE